MGLKQLDIVDDGIAAEIERQRVTLLSDLESLRLLKRAQIRLLWTIHGFTKKKSTANGTYEWLCERTGFKRTTVYKTVKLLREANLITTWEVRRGLLVKENEYAINWESISEVVMSGQLQKHVQNELEYCEIKDETTAGTAIALSSKSELTCVQKVNSGEFKKRTHLSSENELSSISTNLKNYSPTPAAKNATALQPTITDADWEVVVVALKVFGILSGKKIQETINAAKAKGTTPQTVMGLIRHAAGKVLELDAAGKPLCQWRMPADDVLDVYDAAGLNRLYFWKPSIVLWRIAQQGERNFQGVAEGWFCPKEDAAAYNAAQVAMADAERRSKPPVPAAAMVDPELDDERARLAKRREQLEAEFGERLDAMALDSVIEMVRSVCSATWQMLLGVQANQDPRKHRLNRFAALKAFEELFGARQDSKTQGEGETR